MTKLTASAAVTRCWPLPRPRWRRNIIVVAHGQANDLSGRSSRTVPPRRANIPVPTVDFRSPEVFDMVAMGQLIDAAVNSRPTGWSCRSRCRCAWALDPARGRGGLPVISMNSGSDVAADLGALLHVGQSE